MRSKPRRDRRPLREPLDEDELPLPKKLDVNEDAKSVTFTDPRRRTRWVEWFHETLDLEEWR